MYEKETIKYAALLINFIKTCLTTFTTVSCFKIIDEETIIFTSTVSCCCAASALAHSILYGQNDLQHQMLWTKLMYVYYIYIYRVFHRACLISRSS